MNIFNRTRPQGIASLPVILLIGGIIIEIGIAGTFLLLYLNNSLYGIRLSSEALSGAQSGVNDALMRIILDKNYNATYPLTVGQANVTVAVCKDSCVSGKDQVTVTSHVLTKQHTLVAIVNVDATTGLVRTDSLQETTQ